MLAPTLSSCKAPISHFLQRCSSASSQHLTHLCRHPQRYHSRLVLGIETTCDETGAAVMDETGNVLAERLHSQKRIHAKNGGIIPFLAQDLHRQFIDPVVQGTIQDAGIDVKDLSAVALSTMPGMPLSLRVGLDYTKDMLLCHPHLPLIPIHHMEAHALTVRMIERVDFPFLVLLVSGGNCILAVARGVGDFLVLGVTWDDAPGEAFDKVARRLKLQHHPECLGLSGGQAIEKMAENGNIRLLMERSTPMSKHRDCNFSFAGLKSMANWLINHHEIRQGLSASDNHHLATINDIAASFQHKVAQHLVTRIARAMLYCQQTELIPEGNQTLEGETSSIIPPSVPDSMHPSLQAPEVGQLGQLSDFEDGNTETSEDSRKLHKPRKILSVEREKEMERLVKQAVLANANKKKKSNFRTLTNAVYTRMAKNSLLPIDMKQMYDKARHMGLNKVPIN